MLKERWLISLDGLNQAIWFYTHTALHDQLVLHLALQLGRCEVLLAVGRVQKLRKRKGVEIDVCEIVLASATRNRN